MNDAQWMIFWHKKAVRLEAVLRKVKRHLPKTKNLKDVVQYIERNYP